MTTHASVLAWRILWPEESGGLQSVGSRRVGQDWAAEQQQQVFLFLGGGPASLWGSPPFPVHKDAQTLPERCLPAPLRQRQPAFTKSFNSNAIPYTTHSHNLTEHLLHMRLTLRWKPHGSWLRGTQSRKCLKFFSQYRAKLKITDPVSAWTPLTSASRVTPEEPGPSLEQQSSLASCYLLSTLHRQSTWTWPMIITMTLHLLKFLRTKLFRWQLGYLQTTLDIFSNVSFNSFFLPWIICHALLHSKWKSYFICLKITHIYIYIYICIYICM